MRFFNRFTLQTPESVELEFTLAGIGNRAYALVIDYIALGSVLIGFLILWAIFSYLLIDTITKLLGGTLNVSLWLFSVQLLITFFIYVGYFVFFETLWRGQTPGKRYVKIRVIRDDGRPVGLQHATLRALLRPFDDLFFLGFFLIALGKREKRLGDWVAGTLVIQEEQPTTSTSLQVSAQAQGLAKQLLEIADCSRLLPEDFVVIREYLQRRKGMLPPAKDQVSRQLATQLKEIIALEKIPPGVSADLFLEAVYLAYQRQAH